MGSGRRTQYAAIAAGKICALCHVFLPEPIRPGERLCLSCTPRYRVYMHFMHTDGWHVSFLEHDCRTPLPLKLTFADPDKIRDMHRRYGSRIAEDVSAMEHGIANGRGGIWLMVEQAQYEILRDKGKGPIR